MARLNYLLLVGWAKDLEGGTPECFEADLDMLKEVAFALELHLHAVRRFHEAQARPPEEDSPPSGGNVVALPPRPGA